MEVTRIGAFQLGWGESLVYDERRDRLYFVDCAASTLHWLDGGEGELRTLRLPSMAAGLVPTEGGGLVGALDDGLHEIDPDAGTSRLLSPYPDGLGGRANDACADLSGNIVTGTLNLEPGPGSLWWFSPRQGWRMLDAGISNTNGPNVAVEEGVTTLYVGDTGADYYRYRYDGGAGAVGDRELFGDVTALAGAPDGTAVDDEGGLWCALVGGRQLARFTDAGLDRTVALPVANPTDVAFGGPDLDRLYVVSIGLGAADDALDGALLRIDGVGARGRPEPRVALSPPGDVTNR
ncbi:MAG: SMP-30/gluconolactonase/LRE family protein [Acidobacteriota bacterium]|nr:SMP-30/gluconolactonase/LRE family protein [Acidobacteriota bacterium]